MKELLKTEKCKSKVPYKIATIIYDEITGEIFRVISCERIGVTEEFNWGLEVSELKKGDCYESDVTVN